MTDIARLMQFIVCVGVDLAEHVIQVHAVDAAGRRIVARSTKRDQFLACCTELPSGCIVAMEACSSGKNDMADAATICEAASRPRMRFVPIKTCKQKGFMTLHRVRSSPEARRAAQLTGIGEVDATALTASVGDFKQFKTGHQFGAWLGLVPRQNSSGGKTNLGRSPKRGDDYLCTLLIQGPKAAVMSAAKRSDPTSRWLVQLTARVGWQKACVAMANKNARILWAVMTREAAFDPNHVSVKPQAKMKPAPKADMTAAGAAACPA